MAEVADHVLLILSIKRAGKFFEGDHICEKVSRDAGVSDVEVRRVLARLVEEGMIEESDGKYRILPRGFERLEGRIRGVWSQLNKSYRAVYLARKYYPKVAGLMMPYLRGRAVSVVKVFSDDNDPINSFSPSFVRYARYKPRKQPIMVSGERELLDLVDQHAVDFFPVIHGVDARRPDWFVFDISAGEKFGGGLAPVKLVCSLACECLEDYGIKPAVKFSGSMELQVWAVFEEHKLPEGYSDYFTLYRDMVAFIQRRVEERIQDGEGRKLLYMVTREGKPATTTQTAGREERGDQILIDPSLIRVNGTVRAPYSMNYETWLTSCPVSDVEEFEPEMASIESVLRNTPEFRLEKSDPQTLIEALIREKNKGAFKET
ncbi:MAG: hypothetical protein KIH01_08590 [Candidatus Freyarchaeota archaeon]|nr:hypothetical protein [Candidatus Jordarchaeia archaeon]